MGKTKRQLRLRINEHKSSIRRADPKSAIARHFAHDNHSMADLTFCGIDMVSHERQGGDIDKALLQ